MSLENCPNCETKFNNNEKKESVTDFFYEEKISEKVMMVLVNCDDCVYSQTYCECPDCGNMSFAIHPHNNMADCTKGECSECGFSQSGGVSIIGG